MKRLFSNGQNLFGCLATLFLTVALLAEEGDVIKQLAEKGVTITENKAVGTTVAIKECSKLTEADFKQIAKLAHVKSISFGLGLTEASLGLLTDLSELESFNSNGMQVSDDGFKVLAHFKKLKNIAIFHPGATFTGTGLTALVDVPSLEKLTVAGSNAFADSGLAAVGKLTQLKEFRSWHAGGTLDGVKSLTALKALKSLNLGQRLVYKPPVSISNETIPVLLEMTSLESLQLGEARMSLAALSQLKSLANLKKLILDGIDISKDDVEALKKELPKVDIKWTEPTEAYRKRITQLFGEK